MLFFCKFEDHTSLLIDDADEASAREVATKIAEGVAPLTVIPFEPRAFVAEVYVSDDDDDDHEPGILVVSPLEHVADLLFALDDAEGSGVDLEDEDDEDECLAEADGDDDAGELFVCSLAPGHDGEHVAYGAKGEELARWPQ
jgi:hypothetical protein